MRRLLLLPLAILSMAFTYPDAGSDGYVTGEQVTAAAMNAIDIALDATETHAADPSAHHTATVDTNASTVCSLAGEYLSGTGVCTADDDVPESGDFAAAADLDATGSVLADAIGATELSSSGVVPGSYTSADITVDADGRITAASNGAGGSSPWTDAGAAVVPPTGDDVIVGGNGDAICDAGEVCLDAGTGTITADGFTARAVDGANGVELPYNTGGAGFPSASGAVYLFSKSDGSLYKRDDGATELSTGHRVLTAEGATDGTSLADCSGATTDKLLYDAATGLLSCGTDQGGGSGGAPTTAPYVTASADPTLTAETVLDSLGALNALITASIADGPHTTDTSAATLCVGSESLRGDGTCVVPSSGGALTTIVPTTGTTKTVTAAEMQGHLHTFSNAAASKAFLPAASAGLHACFYDLDGTAALSIEPDAADAIRLGALSLATGNVLDSPGTAGARVCLTALDATTWVATDAEGGAWADGGPGSGSGAATDYRTILDRCWLMATDGTEAGALADNCTTGTALSVAVNSALSYSVPPPDGSPTGADALDLNGFDQYFTIPDTSFGTDSTSWSMGCWVDPDADGDVFLSKGGLSRELATIATNQFVANSGNGGGHLSAATYTDGTWVHVAYTYDGAATDTVRIYVNGVESCSGGTCTTGVDPVDNASPFAVGADEGGGADYNGQIYECFYTDAVLTQPQICEIVEHGIDGTAGAARITSYGGG